ncbi:MAG TPA: HNH endonuclease signature motif containing protein [Gemmataceae bacterium]|jgi:hypothetical protein|nr:HNH endonuclease signature motif containing protein [Gemmataceae bacterium]
MDRTLEQLIWDRAAGCCEYCLIPNWADDLPFHIDHVIARQHGGKTIGSNLALACYACNLHKGPNIAGRDPKSGRTVRLFHPRLHKWKYHFKWRGGFLVGRTPLGRATIVTLGINLAHRLELRELLMFEGQFPRQSPLDSGLGRN